MARQSGLTGDKMSPVIELGIKNAFDECGDGLFGTDGLPNFDESDMASFSICDDEDVETTRIAKDGDDLNKSFDIINRNERVISVLPFDHKIIKRPAFIEGGVADCGLLTNTELSLVEFKTQSNTPSPKSLNKEYCKAMNQLWHTFSVVKEQCEKIGIDIESFVDVDFYIVNDKMFAQRVDLYLPVRVSSQQQSYQTQFQQDHNGFPLFFDTKREFL